MGEETRQESDWPSVSIVMPIRNEAAFIERTIRSVLDNDYPADKIEVLVADGESDDRTQEVVNRIGEKEARVKLLNNTGRVVSTGLNLALRESKGEVFIRVDGHCKVTPDFIRKSVGCLLDHPEAWVAGGYWRTVSKGYVGQVVAAATQSPIGVGNARHRLGNYDGWDGCNVWVSTDGGDNFDIAYPTTPLYDCNHLYSFSNPSGWNLGVIPGWVGINGTWTPIEFDLSSYKTDSVIIRFAFASDEGFCTLDDPSLFLRLCFHLGDALYLKLRYINFILIRNKGSLRHPQGVLQHTVILQPLLLVW